MGETQDLTIGWCSDVARSDELARFFAAHVAPEYLSHSELQGPRAIDVGRWRPGIEGIFHEEIAKRVAEGQGRVDAVVSSFPILEARRDGRLAGMAFVSIVLDAPVPYAILEDVVVDPQLRGGGVGSAIIDWVSERAKAAGCKRVFLESGLGNHRAHHLFEHKGFETCSIVMMKRLADPD